MSAALMMTNTFSLCLSEEEKSAALVDLGDNTFLLKTYDLFIANISGMLKITKTTCRPMMS